MDCLLHRGRSIAGLSSLLLLITWILQTVFLGNYQSFSSDPFGRRSVQYSDHLAIPDDLPHLRRVPFRVPDPRRKLALIHIGKSGGTTAELLFKMQTCTKYKQRQQACRKEINNIKPAAISSRINRSFHEKMVLFRNFTSFVVSVRDPLDRTISAFMMQHPQHALKTVWQREQVNNFIFQCFPTLEDFAMALTGNVTGPSFALNRTNGVIKDCAEASRTAILGRNATTKYVVHMFYNYNYYIGNMPQNKEVFVLRSSHFFQDYKAINSLLGGSEEEVAGLTEDLLHTRDSSGLNYTVPKQLSPTGKEAICQYLQKEYELYFMLLERAVNLSEEDVLQMKIAAVKQCPNLFVPNALTKDF